MQIKVSHQELIDKIYQVQKNPTNYSQLLTEYIYTCLSKISSRNNLKTLSPSYDFKISATSIIYDVLFDFDSTLNISPKKAYRQFYFHLQIIIQKILTQQYSLNNSSEHSFHENFTINEQYLSLFPNIYNLCNALNQLSLLDAEATEAIRLHLFIGLNPKEIAFIMEIKKEEVDIHLAEGINIIKGILNGIKV